MREKATHPIRREMTNTGATPLWKIADVCEYLQMSTGVVRALIYRRVIPHFKCGRHIRFRQNDIDRWYEGHQRGGQ